jgi:O-antigen/teichoic acid export membrane protein
MSGSVRLAKNAGLLMGMELGIRGLDAVVAILLARYLAPEGFGLLSFALSFSGMFGILPGLGMGVLTVRDIARDPKRLSPLLSNGLVIKIGLAALTLLAIWLGSVALGHAPTRRELVLLAGMLMVIDTNVEYFLAFFQATNRTRTKVLVSIGIRAGWLAGSLAVMALGGGVRDLITVRAGVTLAGLAVTLGLIHWRIQPIRWNWSPSSGWQMMRASLPFALYRVWLGLYGDIDMVMLSQLRGDVATSLYSAAQKVIRVFAFIPAGFNAATLPAMARSSRTSRTEVRHLASKTTKYLLMLGLAVAGGICVLAEETIVLLYGHAYREAAQVLRIAIWSVAFTFLNGTIISALAAVDRERQSSNRLFIGVVFSALSNFAVIPAYGAAGAAATTLMSRALMFFLQWRLLRTVLPGFRVQDAGRLLAACAVMMAAAWVSRPAGLPAAVLAGAAAYVGMLVATRAIGRADVEFLGRLLRQRGKAAHRHADALTSSTEA